MHTSFFKGLEYINDYYNQYKENKTYCDLQSIILAVEQYGYVQTMVWYGVITGRVEISTACSGRTLYRKFKANQFDCLKLPVKGKQKHNRYKENRGKQLFKRNISERLTDYSQFQQEFGYLEGDILLDINHKSVVTMLVECLSKVTMIWLEKILKNLFKSITFDCEKEFLNWKI